jgi:hypothetical protein
MNIGRRVVRKVVDDNGNRLTFKLYLPLKNIVEGDILTKGGNVLEYKAKLKALLKPKCNCPAIMKIVPLMQHKRKKEKSPPLESFDDDVS